MAGKGSQGRRSSNGRKDFGVDFVTIRLSDAQKAEIKETPFSFEDLENALTRWVESGQKVSFTWGDRNGAIICTLTSKENPETKRKACVSSFGPDVITAAMVAWYKFAVLTDGGNWELYEVDEEERMFG